MHLDFAGGTVVHISSGFAALAGALVLGRRLGYGKVPMEPHKYSNGSARSSEYYGLDGLVSTPEVQEW